MTDRSKDELADALARLSAGDVDPREASHHDEPVAPPAPPAAAPPKSAVPKAAPPRPIASPAKPIPRPAAPGTGAPTAKRPAAPTPARPASPPAQPPPPARAPAPARPAAPGAPAPSNPTRSARPSVPGLVTPASTAPSRPAVPTAPPAPPIVQPVPLAEPEAAAAAEETPPAESDDDAVIVPAAPQEYLGHTPVRPHRHKTRAQKLDYDSLKFRQTTIPIFLTTGVMLFLSGVLRFIVGTDAPLSDMPIWLAFIAWVAAAFMIGGAIMNMMRVRNQLDRAASGDAK